MNSLIKQKQHLSQCYLTRIYNKIAKQQPIILPPDYGEILFEGVNKIISKLKWSATDSFVDLGSGTGKVVSQLFLQTDMKKVVGIELCEPLHRQAQSAADCIKTELPDFFVSERELNFHHANFLDFSLSSFTICLINAICFPTSLIHCLGQKLNEAKSIRLVLTLRPIPTLTQFKYNNFFKIECSWASSLCYLYIRSG